MTTMQQKIEETFEALAKSAGLELVRSYVYSNAGRLYFQKPHTFENVLVLSVTFQSNYIEVSGLQEYPAQTNVSVWYDKSEKMSWLFDAVRGKLGLSL